MWTDSPTNSNTLKILFIVNILLKYATDILLKRNGTGIDYAIPVPLLFFYHEGEL